MTVEPEALLQFWWDEVGPDRWFDPDPALDAEIKSRFEEEWTRGRRGQLKRWEDSREGALALAILLDQFPRNMFRGRAQAFASDDAARAAADRAIVRGFKRRLFFYLPFVHAENLADQDRSVALIGERLGPEHDQHSYAIDHRDQILRFGRFPGRNAALGRKSTPAESAYLDGHPPY